MFRVLGSVGRFGQVAALTSSVYIEAHELCIVVLGVVAVEVGGATCPCWPATTKCRTSTGRLEADSGHGQEAPCRQGHEEAMQESFPWPSICREQAAQEANGYRM